MEGFGQIGQIVGHIRGIAAARTQDLPAQAEEAMVMGGQAQGYHLALVRPPLPGQDQGPDALQPGLRRLGQVGA